MGTPTDIEEQVNAAINNRTEVDGKMQFAADLDPLVQFAANAEIRRRDTQASYTKTQQKNLALEAENEHLASTWEKEVARSLTVEQQNELDELKHTDVELWREKINEYESSNSTRVRTKRAEIKDTVVKETELQQRTRLLEEYNTANPDLALTDDVIDNDIPPRITKELAEGKITFDQYIDKCATFLSKGKVIHPGEQAPGDPDLSKTPGRGTPDPKAVGQAATDSYSKEIY
jgi:hypothetical protein